MLSRRRLNRATLARQYLLERAPGRAIDAIEHLGGMQSQAPLAPYVGLWTRLRGFAPDELSALTGQRQVVRLHLMRALLDQAGRLLAERPPTRGELGRLLVRSRPGADPSALAYAVTHHLALCQVPPRGVWGGTGPAAWAPVESWLGAPLRPVPADALVLRHLGAFGPASVATCSCGPG
ncbi:DNA glycosylase AlkZ-like family protein [Nonomuraea sp. NPDC049655]|uniref:DNA glycosylase AlkZ-like family protein n=1 Tax=Nonomuraea sp. NPDC049655 TaxID=3364355 RepID=UPI00379F8A0F